MSTPRPRYPAPAHSGIGFNSNVEADDKGTVFQDLKVVELLQSGDCKKAEYTIKVEYHDFTVDDEEILQTATFRD
jgi:hypothetical protein